MVQNIDILSREKSYDLHGYCDAGDETDRRSSVTGSAFLMQPTVAISTTEAVHGDVILLIKKIKQIFYRKHYHSPN